MCHAIRMDWRKSSYSNTHDCVEWRKSSFSSGGGGTGGDCVEVAPGEPVQVRDSKDPEGPILTISAAGWQEFLAGVKAGEFG